jgi:hypothetical protein
MTNVGVAGVGARTNSQGSDTVRLLIGLPARLADLKGGIGEIFIFFLFPMTVFGEGEEERN